MSKSSGKIQWWKILLPTFIGIGAIGYLFLREFSLDDLKEVPLTSKTFFWFFVAFCFMIGRDLGFVIRYRYLTEKVLSWTQCIKVTLLAEFGSSITPSVVGGSSMAVLFLAKENIPVGKSTAMVFVTMLLDESFYVLTFPILLILIPYDRLFYLESSMASSILVIVVVAYLVKILLCLGLILGLFIKPQLLRSLLIRLFRLPFLRKWHYRASKVGDDIITSSKEIRGKKFKFWRPLIFGTIMSWCSRFLVVNALLMAFFDVSDNLIVFARQFITWIVMIISPTPGGTGISEFVFDEYLSEFIPVADLVPVIILLWRLLTYYNYLFIGVLLVPRWVRDRFIENED